MRGIGGCKGEETVQKEVVILETEETRPKLDRCKIVLLPVSEEKMHHAHYKVSAKH